MSSITKLLNELLIEIKNTQSLVPILLFEGLNRAQIDDMINGLGIQLPEEVYELYEWKNGTALSSSLIPHESWLFPLGTLSSLEDSIDRYQHQMERDEYWTPNLFILFADDGGEMFLIDFDENSPTYKMIYKHSYFSVDYEVTITCFDSLEALIKTVIEWFKEKACFYDPDSLYKIRHCYIIST